MVTERTYSDICRNGNNCRAKLQNNLNQFLVESSEYAGGIQGLSGRFIRRVLGRVSDNNSKFNEQNQVIIAACTACPLAKICDQPKEETTRKIKPKKFKKRR